MCISLVGRMVDVAESLVLYAVDIFADNNYMEYGLAFLTHGTYVELVRCIGYSRKIMVQLWCS